MKFSLTPYPARDWLIILAVSALTLASLAILAVLLFVSAQSSLAVAPEPTRAPATVSAKELREVLEIYRARQASYEALVPPAKK